MSHDHSHHVEENPQVKFASAWYIVLIIAGFVLGLFAFVKSMSHSDHDDHGSDHHASVSHEPHSWDAMKPLEFSSLDIAGEKAAEEPAVKPVAAPAADSNTVNEAALDAAPSADSTTHTDVSE